PGAAEEGRRTGELPHAPLELRTLVARQARRPCRFVRHRPTGSGVSQANGAGEGSQTAADSRPRVRLITLGPQGEVVNGTGHNRALCAGAGEAETGVGRR